MGISFGSVIGTIGSLVGIESGSDAVNAYQTYSANGSGGSSILSGITGNTSCPGQPTLAAMSHMMSSLSAVEKREFIAAWGRSGSPYDHDISKIARDVMGGRDCQIDSPTDRRFNEVARKMLARYPLGTSVPAYGTADYPEEWEDPSAWERIRATGGSIFEDLLRVGGNVVESGVEGALERSSATAEAAARGSDVGRQIFSVQNVLLLIAGFAVVFFILKK